MQGQSLSKEVTSVQWQQLDKPGAAGEKRTAQCAIRSNFFVRIGGMPDSLLDQTDAEQRTSDLPACDNRRQVVGLHLVSRKAAPEAVPQKVIGGRPVEVKLPSEAIAIHAVLDHLPSKLKARIRQQEVAAAASPTG